MSTNDILITQFASLFELTCDYVIDEFVIDGEFKPVFPEMEAAVND